MTALSRVGSHARRSDTGLPARSTTTAATLGPGRAASAIASWTRLIAAALEAHGLHPHALLVSSGLGADALADPNARRDAAAVLRFLRASAEALNRPACGLLFSGYARPATFHALGYAVLASASLREAIQRVLRHSRLLSDSLSLVSVLAEQELRLSLHLKLISSPPDPLVVDLAMSLLVRALRVLMDPSYTPLRVELRRPRPADVAPYERFFRCTVEFGAASDVITFRGGELDRPLPGANPELAKHCDALIREYLARAENASIVDRLRAKLASETAESIAPVQIARSLGMSERSLQRVLAKHNTTYLRVLNETRRDLACAYLCDRDRSMAAIACCLGFRDASSFARAFRRWTGTSPSQYRQTLFIA